MHGTGATALYLCPKFLSLDIPMPSSLRLHYQPKRPHFKSNFTASTLSPDQHHSLPSLNLTSQLCSSHFPLPQEPPPWPPQCRAAPPGPGRRLPPPRPPAARPLMISAQLPGWQQRHLASALTLVGSNKSGGLGLR